MYSGLWLKASMYVCAQAHGLFWIVLDVERYEAVQILLFDANFEVFSTFEFWSRLSRIDI